MVGVTTERCGGSLLFRMQFYTNNVTAFLIRYRLIYEQLGPNYQSVAGSERAVALASLSMGPQPSKHRDIYGYGSAL